MMKPQILQIRMLLFAMGEKIAIPHPLPLSQGERGDMVFPSLWDEDAAPKERWR